jgi:hypothetical protein
LSAALSVGASAMYIPDSDVTEDRDTRRTVTKTYTLSPEDDPDALIEETFSRDGFDYSFLSITKSQQQFEDIQRHSETMTLDTDTDNLSDILSHLSPAIEYEHNGYSGALYLDHTTIATEAAGYSTKGYTVRDTKTISGLDRNDPEYVPKTTVKNGMTLSLANVEWAVSGTGFSDGALVPTQFTATATYTGTGYSKTADGYVTTAEYTGDITASGVMSVVYTVTYMGEPAQEPEQQEEPEEPEDETVPEETAPIPPYVFIIVGCVLLLAAAGTGIFIWRKQRSYIDDGIYPPE